MGLSRVKASKFGATIRPISILALDIDVEIAKTDISFLKILGNYLHNSFFYHS